MNEQMINDFKLGSNAYVVYKDRNNSQQIEEVVVVKLARKYITVWDAKGYSEDYFYDFTQNAFMSRGQCGNKSSLHCSKDLAKQYILKLSLKPKISLIIHDKINNFSSESLEAIYKIIQIYDDEAILN